MNPLIFIMKCCIMPTEGVIQHGYTKIQITCSQGKRWHDAGSGRKGSQKE